MVPLSRQQFLRGLSGGVASVAAGALVGSFANPRGAAAATPGGGAAAGGLTAQVADFVVATRFEDLPPELIELGKQHILDAVGLAIAGQHADSGPIVRKYLVQQGTTTGPSTILGSTLRAQPRFAAFANGVAIHADDFDDTQLAVAKDRVYGLLTHPTVATAAAALATAEARGSSGRDFMLAYLLGVEVSTKIAEAISPRSYESGFHSTSMCGGFGAAASTAKLRGLDAGQLRNAFGVAGAEASGLRENFGTMTKPFQAGHAAESGVVAAELAALGWTAAQDILEAKRGFFAAFGGGWNPAAIEGKLGRPWSLMSPGVSIKPYPSGSLTHPAMDVMTKLIADNSVKAEDVVGVRVGTNRQMLNTLIHHRPTTGLQGKFSMEYCMAVLLVVGRAGLAQFQDDVVRRPDLQAMIRRVDFYNNPAADAAGSDKMRSFVEVKLQDGRRLTGQGDFAKGSPEMPMSFDDSVRKFTGCVEVARLKQGRAERMVASIRALDKVADMRSVFAGMFV